MFSLFCFISLFCLSYNFWSFMWRESFSLLLWKRFLLMIDISLFISKCSFLSYDYYSTWLLFLMKEFYIYEARLMSSIVKLPRSIWLGLLSILVLYSSKDATLCVWLKLDCDTPFLWVELPVMFLNSEDPYVSCYSKGMPLTVMSVSGCSRDD